jgi:uncharacterized protein YydD (DUF2326 family)
MKLSRLYSNIPEIFQPIRFKDGLNVVVAKIDHPKDDTKLGHNLGKSLLIDVLDFALLKGIDKNHLFKRRADLFDDLVFFLEIEFDSGGFLTIRREVAQPTKIALKRHSNQHADFTNLSSEGWDHWHEAFKKAVTLLDGLLAFAPIKPWSYRTGVGYFLRRQADYLDVFQLNKFSRGRDIAWKPYLAKVLGFDDSLISHKYEADADLSELNAKRNDIEAETNLKPKDFDKLRASIEVKEAEVGRKTGALDAFDFHTQESELNRDLAETVERDIVANNEFLYNARHDLEQIEKSLNKSVDFDLAEVKRVFDESEIAFPQQLERDYDDLVDFNHKILTERQTYLAERASVLKDSIQQVERQNAELSSRRQSILKVLGGTDSLRKFKDLQHGLDEDRAQLELLKTKALRIEQLLKLTSRLKETRQRVEGLTAEIEQAIHATNERYTEIRKTFSHIIQSVLHHTALVYVETNESGNMFFHANFTDDANQETEEDRGTTFKKTLCVAFDLAVLISYAKEPFFHFVYHDGGLENLQNKLKVVMLRVIREICDAHNIQYIFSSLSEDLPTTDEPNLWPQPNEIILTLDDSGDSGRLFKMKSF